MDKSNMRQHERVFHESFHCPSFLEELQPHEQIELLLSFTTNRQDTKEISRRLIKRFRNRRGVLEADYESLISVSGVGKKTALLIMLAGELAREYDAETLNDPQWQLTQDRVERYVTEQIGRKKKECFLVVCLDAKYRIICKQIMAEGSATTVTVLKRDIVKKALVCEAASILIGHNHPRGTPMPSKKDIEAASAIKETLEGFSIHLYAFVIAGECGETYSVLRSGLV
ncbi:MAG: hypothetical protein LBR76_00775 [Oscillospiraceae bacterium]|jgi:DNA repair protein RadC|nr:hypothetical protein [Oscillospiraceae bacterium]